MQKFCIAIFLLNSLQSQQQKMDHAEILHFNLEIYMRSVEWEYVNERRLEEEKKEETLQ